MTSQEVLHETDEVSQGRSLSPALDYPTEESHWSQNHGPTLFAITAFTLIVGYGVIFFNSTEIEDHSKPLVPNNFVPDEEPGSPAEPETLEGAGKESATEAAAATTEKAEAD